MTLKDDLSAMLKAGSSGPFLFVGSGFARRYLGTEDWRGLLARFCTEAHPIEYYLAAADGDVPRAARLLAVDFNERWWTDPQFASNVSRFRGQITTATAALRLEISLYLRQIDQSATMNSALSDEVALLSQLNVDGVITTNWDLLLEHIFPDYRVYVGQEELLFSSPQEIGEIYKIHGSCSAPESLVLTDDDYSVFAARNAYLAAKLITIFVEHPVIFIGYSIADPNISSLLKAIASCIGKEKVEQLRQNLIFVQRAKNEEDEGVSETYLTIDGIQVPLVLVKAESYIPIYEAIDSTKRKIPARVLRFCKEQLYELVKSAEPEKKLCVVGLDEIEKKDDVEFLVGVGIVSRPAAELGEQGYAPIDSKHLLADLLHEDRGFDPKQILEHVIRVAGRNSKNIPVFKYLHHAGVRTLRDYEESGYALDKWVRRESKEFRSKVYAGSFRRHHRHQSLKELVESCTPENAAAYIPFLAADKIDLKLLRAFLIENEDKLEYSVSSYASSFRKLASLYDRLRWGWWQ